MRVTPEVKVVYDRIDSLSPGQIVMLPCEYDPSMAAEMSPMHLAILRHCFSKNLRVLETCLMSNGVGLVEGELRQVAGEYDKKYGEDYVFLGYKPYPGIIIMAMGEDFRNPFPTDYYNTPLDRDPDDEGREELSERRAGPHDQLDERNRLLDHLRDGPLQVPAGPRVVGRSWPPTTTTICSRDRSSA